MLKIKKTAYIFLLGVSSLIFADGSCSNDGCCSPVSQNLWQPHAFSNYASRELLILEGLEIDNSHYNQKWLSRLGFATEYMKNFGKSCQGLGAMPFWSGSNKMTIGNNTGQADLDAFQFGMGDIVTESNGIAGTIALNPEVQHTGTEFLWYVMQQNQKVGAYFKFKVPLGAMIVKSPTCETPIQKQADGSSPAFPVPYPIAPIRYDSISEALTGGYQNDVPLYNYGKLGCCSQTVIRLGDITGVIGANFLAKKEGHFGVGVKFSCPTGNVPQALTMLEPIFGRAGHWGLGGELSAHYEHNFYNRGCGNHQIKVWLQAEAMHLFSGRQPSWRSFDLKANGRGSKYLLLQKYAHNQSSAPDYPFISVDEIVPAINVTTLPVISSFGVEGNIAVLFDYIRNNWSLGASVDVWARSSESLCINKCAALQLRNQDAVDYDLNDYAVMGRQVATIGGNTTWCEPLARINKSLPFQGVVNQYPSQIKDASLSENRIPFAYDQALDIKGAAACQVFTTKVIGELGYTWSENNYQPRFSVFGGAELAGKKYNWLNLWSVGLQGSLQF